jgi:hypothetical protein
VSCLFGTKDFENHHSSLLSSAMAELKKMDNPKSFLILAFDERGDGDGKAIVFQQGSKEQIGFLLSQLVLSNKGAEPLFDSEFVLKAKLSRALSNDPHGDEALQALARVMGKIDTGPWE